MRALVTGGAGFIGSTLVDRLLAEGHAVDVIDDLSTGSLANLATARAAGGALSFHHLDVTAPELADVMVMRRPEVVFHLAGLGSAASSIEQPIADAQLNVLGSLRILDAARLAGCRKVVVGLSAGVMFGAGEASGLPVGDLTRFRASSPHAAGTHAVLDYLTVYRDLHGLEYTALACSDVYGPRDAGEGGGIVAGVVASLLANRRPVLFGAAGDTRDFVYVDDAVDAFSRAGDRGSGLVLNIATGRETALGELCRLVATALSSTLVPRYAPRRRGEARRIALDPARAALHLDWRPWTGVAEGIGLLLERLDAPASGRQRR